MQWHCDPCVTSDLVLKNHVGPARPQPGEVMSVPTSGAKPVTGVLIYVIHS